MKKQKDNDKNSKGGGNGSGNSYVKSSNIVERSKPTGKGTISIGFGKDITTFKDPSDKYSYHSNTTSKGGDGSISGGGGIGSQSGVFDHRLHQLHPRDAETFIERIKASESEIQKLVNQYRPLNPKSNEESLRVCAIITLGIATDKELEGLKNYKIEQEKAVSKIHPSDSQQEKTLAVNVFQKMNPYLTQLKPDEWHLGVHTASFEGRKSKDTTYGLSNQIITCLEHLKTHGGADTLKVLTFMQCDLTPDDMIYFGNTILIYPLSLNYLDFSYNRIGDIGTISFINSFVTSPTGKYPMHHIINLNLSNNGIGDDGTAHIAAYLKHGYMPATTHVNLADNIITDKGALCFAESLNSSVNKLKVLHLEGNNITKTGEGYLVKALLNKAVQHMVIYTQKLEQNSKLLPGIGTKEEKIAMYREYLKQGIEKGTNDQAIVVDKTFWGKIKHTGNQLDTAKIGIGGFIKCNWQPDEVIESYAQENFVAKISKTLGKILGKLNVVNGVTSCYLQATDEMYTSVPGQKVLTHKLSELEGNHELQVIGESEFSSDY